MKHHRIGKLIGSGLVAGVMAFTGSAGAADFYEGKQITLVIGLGMGGTYGTYSQLIADSLARHIPGKPSIIVQSMPGAGGLKAMNFAGNVMRPDGLNIFMPMDTTVVVQLLQDDKVKYDARKWRWIGAVNQTNTILVVKKETGVKTLADLKGKEVVIGAVGTGSPSFLFPALINGTLDTKLKIVKGYQGSAKTGLALEQGEIQGAAFNWLFWRFKYLDNVKNGDFVPVMQVGVKADPDLPDVPQYSSYVSGEGKKVAAFFGTHGLIGRSLAVPEGFPAEHLATLRASFQKMIADKEFVASAKSKNLRIIPATGEEVETVVYDALNNASPAVVAMARKAIFGDN